MSTFYDLIAHKLELADADARAALPGVSLDNIDRWMGRGHTAPRRLEQWRHIILRAQQSGDGFEELLRLLREPSEGAQRLRDFSPFAGTLTREERRQAIPECVYHF